MSIPPEEIPAPPADIGALPFENFVAYLRALGFRVGTDHVLKLHRSIASLDNRSSPKDIELMLCCVFSTNADQQGLFYRAFQNYFSVFFGSRAPAPGALPVAPIRTRCRGCW